MRLLLDTHTVLWWVTSDPSLSSRARTHIARSEEVIVSAASAWEMAIKVSLGRLPSAIDLVNDFESALAKDGFRALVITPYTGPWASRWVASWSPQRPIRSHANRSGPSRESGYSQQ